MLYVDNPGNPGVTGIGERIGSVQGGPKGQSREIEGKIDPNANLRDSFKPGSLWNETNYREAYVNFNYAKVALEKKDWREAHDGLNYAQRNLGPLVDRVKKDDRVSAWPDGAAKWVQDTSADVAR